MSSRRLALVLVCALAPTLLACERKVPEPTPDPNRPAPARTSEPEPDALIKEDTVVGTGREAKDGDKVRVHYTGRLLKTKAQFDSSVGKDPFEFTLGAGDVIKGWDEGVVGMKIGGKRKLTIPSKLGYGEAGSPPKIPGKSTLVFDIELLDIAPFSNGGEAGAGDAKKKGDKAK